MTFPKLLAGLSNKLLKYRSGVRQFAARGKAPQKLIRRGAPHTVEAAGTGGNRFTSPRHQCPQRILSRLSYQGRQRLGDDIFIAGEGHPRIFSVSVTC